MKISPLSLAVGILLSFAGVVGYSITPLTGITVTPWILLLAVTYAAFRILRKPRSKPGNAQNATEAVRIDVSPPLTIALTVLVAVGANDVVLPLTGVNAGGWIAATVIGSAFYFASGWITDRMTASGEYGAAALKKDVSQLCLRLVAVFPLMGGMKALSGLLVTALLGRAAPSYLHSAAFAFDMFGAAVVCIGSVGYGMHVRRKKNEPFA